MGSAARAEEDGILMNLDFSISNYLLEMLDDDNSSVNSFEDEISFDDEDFPFIFQSDETIMNNDVLSDDEEEEIPDLEFAYTYPADTAEWDRRISSFMLFSENRTFDFDALNRVFTLRRRHELEEFYEYVEDLFGWDNMPPIDETDIHQLPLDIISQEIYVEETIVEIYEDIIEDHWSLLHDVETNPGPSDLSFIYDNLDRWIEEHNWKFYLRCKLQRDYDIRVMDDLRVNNFQIKLFGVCRKALKRNFDMDLSISQFQYMLRDYSQTGNYDTFFLRISFLVYDKLATLGKNVVKLVERAKTFLTPPRSPKSPLTGSLVTTDKLVLGVGPAYCYLMSNDWTDFPKTYLCNAIAIIHGKIFHMNGPNVIAGVCYEEVLRTPGVFASEFPSKMNYMLTTGNLLPLVPLFMHFCFDLVPIDIRIRILIHTFWNYIMFTLHSGYNQHLGAWLFMLYLMHDIETNPGPSVKQFKKGRKDYEFFIRLISNPHNAVKRIEKHFSRAEGYRLQFKRNLLSFFVDHTKPQADWDVLGFNKLTQALEKHSTAMSTIAANVVIPQVEKCRQTFSEVAKEGFSINHTVDLFSGFSDVKIRLALLLTAFCVINAVEMKYGSSSSISLMKFLIVSAGAAAIIATPSVSNMFTSWFSTVPQSDESSVGWVSLLLEGVQLSTMGFTLITCKSVDLSKTMDMIVRESKNLSFIVDKVIDWFKRAVIYVADKFHLDVSMWFSTNDTRVKELQQEVIRLQEENLANPMGITLHFNERVTRLSMKVNDMIAKTPNTPENNAINAVLTRLSKDLFSLSRMAAECGLEAGERNDPAAVMRVGAPGCGKSHDIDTAAMELAIEFASADQLADIARNWKSQIYIWPLDGKHHDQYCGQMICMFPDIFSATDAEGQPSEALYLIYLISGTPLNLLAAELSKKQRLWFISRIVMLASNKLYLPSNMFKSIHNPDALLRRLMECCYYQWCKPEYAQRDAAGNIIIDPTTNRVMGYENDLYLYGKIDKNKVKGVPDDDIWLFRKHDLSTGGFADNQILTRREYMQVVKDYIRNKMENGDAKRRLLKERSIELVSRRFDTRPQVNSFTPMIDETFKDRTSTKPQSHEGETIPNVISEDIYIRLQKLYDEVVLRGIDIKEFLSKKLFLSSLYCERETQFIDLISEDRDLFYYFSNMSIVHIRKILYEQYSSCNTLWRQTKNMCVTNAFTLYKSIINNINSFLSIPDSKDSVTESTSHIFWQYIKDPSLLRCLGFVGLGIATFSIAVAGIKLALKYLEPAENAQPQVDSMIPGEEFITSHQRNILACFIKHKTGNRHPCNVFMLGDRFGVTVRHLHTGMKARMEHRPDDVYHLVLVSSRGGTLEDSTLKYDYSKIQWFEHDEDLAKRDLIVFKLPDDAKYPCMERFIPPLKALEYILQKGNLSATFAKIGIDKSKEAVASMRFEPMSLTLNNRLCVYNTSTLLDDKETPTGRVTLRSWNGKSRYGTFRTEVGDCASICVITDERKNYCVNLDYPQAASEWIAYLHVAITDDLAQGVPIYRELFSKYFEMIKTPQETDFMERLQEACGIVTQALEANAINQECIVPLKRETIILDKHHISDFTSSEIIENNSRSEIKKSKLYGIDPLTRKPARLHNFTNKEGDFVDVMKKAREPYGSNDVVYDPVLVRRIIQDAMTHVYNTSSVPVKTEVLSLDQAIKGDPAYCLGGLNANSSTGFIFRVLKKRLNLKGKGKRWMYEGDQLKPQFYEIIKFIVEKNIEKLKRGERIFNVYIDNLKDELLSLEKVKAGKTRLFCSADMIYLLISRMYFGAFAGWIVENRIDNGIAIGINPYSRDWDKSANHLLRNSLKFIFGDYGKFDKKQKRILMEACLVLMDMFYGENGKLERKLLFEEIVDSLHVVYEDGRLVFYTWDHGNTSGNFLTAILNSLVNISIIFIVAVICQLTYKGIKITSDAQYDFEIISKNVSYLVLGDDLVLSVTDELPYLTFNTFKIVCEQFLGLEFTDELKTSGTIPDYRNIEDGSFLGRKFILGLWLGSPKWWAPLRIYSIVECVQWIKGVFDPDIEVAKIEAMNLELSEWHREIFEFYVPRYAQACLQAYGKLPKYTDYDTARATIVGMSTHQYSFDTFLVEKEDSLGNNQSLEFQNMICNLLNEKEHDSEAVQNILDVSGDHLHHFSEGPLSNPQSEEVKMSDFDVDAVADKESTALFIEGDSVEVGNAASTHNVDTYIEQEASIKAFLSKPVVLSTGTWVSGTAAGTDIAGAYVKDYVSTPIYAEKIKGFRLFKGDFVVSVRLNASAFQQGKLILHYIPFFEHVSSDQVKCYNRDLIMFCQHPHVQVDCRGTTYSLRIPYIAPSHYFDLVDQKWAWGAYFLTVLSPLETGTMATADVDYTIYGHWENVKLCAPTLPQSKETMENKGSISSGLRALGKVATTLGRIPKVASYAQPLAWAANAAGDLASAFGMSKPRELEGVTTVGQQTLKYTGTADGPDVAIPGGVICENRIETLDYLSYTNEDEMSMAYLQAIPYFMGNYTWTTATAKGNDLVSGINIGPDMLHKTVSQTYNAKIATYSIHTPIWLFSQLFDKWRGGFKLIIKLVKTEMHTGRFEVTWTPGINPTAPTNTNSEYSLRTIVDVRGEDEIEISLPYLLSNDYSLSGETSGKLSIRVIDRLRAPDSCAQQIRLLLFIRGDDDLEFACPGISGYSLSPFEPQSDEAIMHSTALPKMSVAPIGAMKLDKDDLFHSKRSVGERVLSIKQLLLRMSPMSGILNGLDLTTKSAIAVDPHGVCATHQNHGTGALESGSLGLDLYNIFAGMYMFWRGGVRLHAIGQTGTQIVSKLSNGTTTGLLTDNVSNNGSGYHGLPYYAWNSNGVSSSNGAIYPVNMMDNSQMVVQHVPYYNKFMCSSTRFYDGTQAPQTVDDYPTTNVLLNSSDVFGAKTVIGRSVCDDFQFMFFVNCPPVLINYV